MYYMLLYMIGLSYTIGNIYDFPKIHIVVIVIIIK